MTDEEILMELHPAFSEETAWMQNNKFPRTYDKEIKAYRAGYEKGAFDYHEGFEEGYQAGYNSNLDSSYIASGKIYQGEE